MYFSFLSFILPLVLSTSGLDHPSENADTCSNARSYIDRATPPWLLERLGAYGLQVSQFEQTGRGIQTVRNREPGDIVISVPKSDALTAAWMLKRFPILDQAVETSLEKYETKLSDEQVLAAGLLFLRGKYDSDGGKAVQEKYIESLPPQQHSVLQMPQALMKCLPPTYQKIIQAYQDRVNELHQSLIRSFDEPESENGVISILQSTTDFLWAFATIRSRCVGMDASAEELENRIRTGAVDSNEVRIMLPGFDLLNHKSGARSTHDFEGLTNSYVLKSEDAYTAGEQVFISYSDERDNLKMLMTYGFCVSDNPAGVVFFDSNDLLRACSEARPEHFSTPVLQQLDGLLLKLGKHRDLYEYDGILKQPKSCLGSGIRMMEELEKQFLQDHDSDSSFYEDILNELLRARKKRVTVGIDMAGEMLRKIVDDEAEFMEWQPMLEAIQTLLVAESQYLSDIEK